MATTYSIPKELPPITLDSLIATRGKLVADTVGEPCRMVSSKIMPEGFWAMVGDHSVYLMTPRGPVSWKTDYAGRVISSDPPNLDAKIEAILSREIT